MPSSFLSGNEWYQLNCVSLKWLTMEAHGGTLLIRFLTLKSILVFLDWEHQISAIMICLYTKSQSLRLLVWYIFIYLFEAEYMVIIDGRQAIVSVHWVLYYRAKNCLPWVLAPRGARALFMWPAYYLGGAHIIFKFNSMLPSLPTLPFFIFMFFSFLILIIDIQKVICNTILIFSHTSQR